MCVWLYLSLNPPSLSYQAVEQYQQTLGLSVHLCLSASHPAPVCLCISHPASPSLHRLWSSTNRRFVCLSVCLSPRLPISSQAVEQYQQALSLLQVAEGSSPCTELAGSMTWELSSTYFTWATTLQDHAPLSDTSQEQVTLRILYIRMAK